MKVFYLILFCLFLINLLFGQSLTLFGRILGDNGVPLQGASVQLENSKRVIKTNSNDHFSFQKLTNSVYKLTVFMMAYKTEELEIRIPTKAITVQLLPLINELREVIVTGNIGAQRKKTESINAETVSSSFIQRNLGGSLMKTLERLSGIKTIGIGSEQSKPWICEICFKLYRLMELPEAGRNIILALKTPFQFVRQQMNINSKTTLIQL